MDIGDGTNGHVIARVFWTSNQPDSLVHVEYVFLLLMVENHECPLANI